MDEFVCYNRALLVHLCKRYKMRGYTKLKKCHLIEALAEYTRNPDKYPIPAGRKTRDIALMFVENSDDDIPRRRKKKGKKGKKRAPPPPPDDLDDTESDDYDAPLVKRGTKKKQLSVSLSQLSNQPFFGSE